ncbi:MAG: hypothetical protein P8L72_01340 [Flavobacteriaceae bacterium]|nr:hypothetical protein [Flavobacteriaceae bacterium]MDG2314014.1 hypothetical protein [Flavobacteriaceae bacterium]
MLKVGALLQQSFYFWNRQILGKGFGFSMDVSYAVNNAYTGGSIIDPGYGLDDCSEIDGLDFIFRLHISSGGNLEENAQWIPLN